MKYRDKLGNRPRFHECHYHPCNNKIDLEQCAYCREHFCPKHIEPQGPLPPFGKKSEHDQWAKENVHPCASFADEEKRLRQIQSEKEYEALNRILKTGKTFGAPTGDSPPIQRHIIGHKLPNPIPTHIREERKSERAEPAEKKLTDLLSTMVLLAGVIAISLMIVNDYGHDASQPANTPYITTAPLRSTLTSMPALPNQASASSNAHATASPTPTSLANPSSTSGSVNYAKMTVRDFISNCSTEARVEGQFWQIEVKENQTLTTVFVIESYTGEIIPLQEYPPKDRPAELDAFGHASYAFYGTPVQHPQSEAKCWMKVEKMELPWESGYNGHVKTTGNSNWQGLTLDDNWANAFFALLSTRRTNLLVPCSTLDEFAQERATTAIKHYETSHYGYDSDFNNKWANWFNGYDFIEEALFPQGTTPQTYIDSLSETAPVHWKGLLKASMNYFGYDLRQGPTYQILGQNGNQQACQTTEIPGPDINVTQYLVNQGCKVIVTNSTWFTIELASFCPHRATSTNWTTS